MINRLIYIILCVPYFLFAQEQDEKKTFSVEAVVIDAQDAMPVPYATILCRGNNKGTISNENGFFKMNGLTAHATLEISFIGYQTEKYNASLVPDTIYLKVKNEVLNEVELLADNSFLYYLLSKSKKTSSYKPKIAKSYFSLETHIDDTQVELVESYYNGHYQSYDLEKLKMKAGRIALKVYDEEVFVSMETSRALHMHRLYDHNDYFPVSPFELSKNKLKKKYNLFLYAKFKDDKNRTIYVVDYTPKTQQDKYFEGRVWIDSLSAKIQKLNLKIDKASIFPFVALTPKDTLLSVSMNITKNFKEIDGTPYVNAIDFNYNLEYKARTADVQFISRERNYTIKNVSSKALLYAYNYDDVFVLPFLEYNSDDMADYRLMNAIPYNQDFWDHMDEFRFNDQIHQNEKFISEEADIDMENIFEPNAYFEKGFWEHAYKQWNKKRLFFREDPKNKGDYNKYMEWIPSERYHLEAQLFLDVNQFKDSLYINTCTVMDPYRTFYHFPKTNKDNAFINMYFDLIEIHRAKFEKEIRLNANSIDAIKSMYINKIEQLEKISQNFFREVARGTSQKGMEKWNRYIYEALEIDNLQIFEVSYEE